MKHDTFLKYIHGNTPTNNDYALAHIFPAILAVFYRYYNAEAFLHYSTIQIILYYIFAWELVGGFIAHLTISTKEFWAFQNNKTKLIYLFIHCWQPIAWFLAFRVDIRFCIVYFLYMIFSTFVLLKIPTKIMFIFTIVFTFVGMAFCVWLEKDYSPFPFGLEWVPFMFYLKLIFAFTLRYKY